MRRVPRLFLAAFVLAAPAVRAVEPASEAAPGPETPALVDISFDEVDLRVFLKLVSRITGRRFIVDSEATGSITLISPDRIPASEVYPLAVAALEARGLAVVEGENAVRVLPKKRGITIGGPVVSGEEEGRPTGLVTRIYAARNVPAGELAGALESLAEMGENSIRAFPGSNRLLITDTAENVERLLAIIRDLDQPGAGRILEIVPLEHAPVRDIADQLNKVLRLDLTPEERIRRSVALGQAGSSELPLEVKIVAEERSNALLVVGTPPEIEHIRSIVERLDVETPPGKSRLNAIPLNYLDPEKTAEMLTTLLSKKLGKEAVKDTAVDFLPGSSALVVDAPPKEFEVIRDLVKQLDVEQDQVLVDVLIAEVTTRNEKDVTVDLATTELPKMGVNTFLGFTNLSPSGNTAADLITQQIFPEGVAFGIARGYRTDAEGNQVPMVPLLIRALEKLGKVRILSNPSLWAQNNTEASFDVVEEIPVLQSTVASGAGTARDIIQNIERVSVGIKLKIKPHITQGDHVQLELNPTVEAVISEQTGDLMYTPTIARRQVKNTVTVADGETIVISGLLKDQEVSSRRKIPLLGDIPVVGFFFRGSAKVVERTNLLILITPHIIRSPAEARAAKDRMMQEHQAGGLFTREESDGSGPSPTPVFPPEGVEEIPGEPVRWPR